MKSGDTLYAPIGKPVCLWMSESFSWSKCPERYCYQFEPVAGSGSKTLDSLVNVFSPNGDNMNDKFYPYYSATTKYPYDEFYIETFKISIFNRWGKLMYESTDFKEGWNGKTNGNNCDEGIYYWIASYTSSCDEKKLENIQKGYVQLLK